MKTYIQTRKRDASCFPPQTNDELGIYNYKIELPYKGMARIYVKEKVDIKRCERVLRDFVGEYEWDYYPIGLIAQHPEDGRVDLICTGKFSLDINDMLNRTKDAGIRCYVVIAEKCYACGNSDCF